MATDITHRFMKHIPRKIFGRGLLAAAAVVFLLPTANLIAQVGPTNVTTLTGGWASHGADEPYYGYMDGYTNTASFNLPIDLALDPSGNSLFIADCSNNAVRWISNLKNPTHFDTQVYTYLNAGNGISEPVAIVVDLATNIYVLNRGDGTNGYILEFSTSDIFQFPGSGNEYAPYNFITTNATHLTNATAMAMDDLGNLYVTCNSNTVIRISPANIVTTVGTVVDTNVNLRGITILNDNEAAMTDAGDNGVWKMDLVTGNATQFTGFHGVGDATGPKFLVSFNHPEKISKAGGGWMVVADRYNHKIKTIDPSGNDYTLFGVNPTNWWAGTDTSGTVLPGLSDGLVAPADTTGTVQAREPVGVLVAPDGSVYDTEVYYDVIRRATSTGLPVASPRAPFILSVTPSIGQVTLTWSEVSGATNYYVKRSNSTNSFTPIASTASTSYTDTDVIAGATYYYVVSAVNPGGESPDSAIASATVPTPPPSAPEIGYFDKEGDPPVFTFHPATISPYVSFNDLNLAINPGMEGISTHFTIDGSDPSATNGSSPPNYKEAGTPLTTTLSSNLMIKAVNFDAGGSSAIASVDFIFQVGTPIIQGDNAAQFIVTNITVGAQMYYTTDGSDPDQTNVNAVGPISSGAMLSMQIPPGSNLVFKVRGFKDSYLPSTVLTKVFSTSNFVANTINFGFASGPGSSKFVASPGQSFVVPVGLSLLSGAPPIYGLQFNVTVTNLVGNVVDPQTIDFRPLIGKPDADNDGYYLPIEPWMFVSDSQPGDDPDAFQYQGSWYQGLEFVDTNNEALLGIGWLEVYGRTNLYNTKSQNLLTYPIVDGLDLNSTNNNKIIGAYSFGIPPNAQPGDTYQIQIGLPSATTFSGLDVDPYGTPVNIEAPANTNLVGPGTINALKNVTIGQIKYLVGDVYPAYWYNAGDFGSSNLNNLDVTRVFDFAAYPIATPPPASDLFDALDSCGGIGVFDSATGYYTNAASYPTTFTYSITNYTYTFDSDTTNTPSATNSFVISGLETTIYIDTTSFTASYYITNVYPSSLNVETRSGETYYFANQYVPNLFDGSDTNINQIAFGDGKLDVCDVYVTFRRSLDTNNLVWFQRFWTNGVRVATATNASVIIHPNIARKTKPVFNVASTSVSITNTPGINFAAGVYQATAGQTVQIPITATVLGPYPLRVAMLGLTVVPLDGSPALTSQVSFTSGSLGAPTSGFADSRGNGNFAAAWLNTDVAGVSGNTIVGYLNVPIPANATSLSAYAIQFDSASGSPNGLASFPQHTLRGLITLSSRTNSCYGDGIPDSWRLRYFGTTNNALSMASADADGTGMDNWQKYVAGLDPLDPSSKLTTGFDKAAAQNPNDHVITWPSVYGRTYVIERTPTLFPPVWTAVSTNNGTGGSMEIHDGSSGGNGFYRVRVQQ